MQYCACLWETLNGDMLACYLILLEVKGVFFLDFLKSFSFSLSYKIQKVMEL